LDPSLLRMSLIFLGPPSVLSPPLPTALLIRFALVASLSSIHSSSSSSFPLLLFSPILIGPNSGELLEGESSDLVAEGVESVDESFMAGPVTKDCRRLSSSSSSSSGDGSDWNGCACEPILRCDNRGVAGGPFALSPEGALSLLFGG
jgi:hypothetical protein